MADVGDFFISVTLDFCYSSPEGEVDAHNPCSRKEFEWIADDFMYQIAPREPESDWLQNPNGLNAGAVSQTFADYFDHWLPGSVGSEAYSPDYQQKFVDLDEDGTDEMLIWNARTGVIYEAVTIMDGVPQCVYDSGIYGDNNQLYLCEGNILDRNCGGSVVQGKQKQLNEYYRMVDKQLLPVECIMEGNDGKFYWSESDCASSLMWREISETEYNAVRAKYVRIPGTLGSLPELSDEVKSQLKNEAESRLLQVLMDQYAFYRPDDGMEYYLTDYCRRTGDQLGFPVSITRYAFVDMDGDGTAEAVVDFKFGENEQVMCMVLKYDSGTVFGAEFYHRQMSHIKKDATLLFFLLTVLIREKHAGKTYTKQERTQIFLAALIFVFASLNSGAYSFRLDLTASQKFTVSPYTKKLLSAAESSVRITYYRSSVLSSLYPQTRDVYDFLTELAADKNVSVCAVSPDKDSSSAAALEYYGIASQQIQTAGNNRTEFINVYSAIVIEYEGAWEVIPFILSCDTLEYDIAGRLEHLITGKKRYVTVLCGNGLSLKSDYSYVIPWLSAQGFICNEIDISPSTL